MILELKPGRDDARHRDAADGRASLPAQADGAPSIAGGDRRLGHAGGIGGRRRGARLGAIDVIGQARRPAPSARSPIASPSGSARSAAEGRDRRGVRPFLPSQHRAPRSHSRPPARPIAIGASTGGTEALKTILRAMPFDAPPIVIVQHMPVGFTAAFAARLADICKMDVVEAVHGDRSYAARLLARGDHHLLVHRRGYDWCRARATRRPLLPASQRRRVVPLGRRCAGAAVVGACSDRHGRRRR